MATTQSGSWGTKNGYDATIKYSDGSTFYASGTWKAELSTNVSTGVRTVKFTVFTSVYVGAYAGLTTLVTSNKWSGNASGTNAGVGSATPKEGTATITKTFTDTNAGTISGTIKTGFTGAESTGFSANYSLTYDSCQDTNPPTISIASVYTAPSKAVLKLTSNKATDELQYSLDNSSWTSQDISITSTSGGSINFTVPNLTLGTKYTIYTKAKASVNDLWCDAKSISVNTTKYFPGKKYTFNIPDSLINEYDKNFYIEPDGSTWIRLVHHNNPASNLFSSTDSFTTSVYKNDDLWFNMALCNQLSGTWEILLAQKLTSSSTESKFRWVQTVNPMNATYDDVTPSKVTFNTTTGYTTPGSTWGGMRRHNDSAYLVCDYNNSSLWFGAIGAWTTYKGGIPAYGSESAITTGYIDVYVRVDNAHIVE